MSTSVERSERCARFPLRNPIHSQSAGGMFENVRLVRSIKSWADENSVETFDFRLRFNLVDRDYINEEAD